jgi:hypothetical protein
MPLIIGKQAVSPTGAAGAAASMESFGPCLLPGIAKFWARTIRFSDDNETIRIYIQYTASFSKPIHKRVTPTILPNNRNFIQEQKVSWHSYVQRPCRSTTISRCVGFGLNPTPKFDGITSALGSTLQSTPECPQCPTTPENDVWCVVRSDAVAHPRRS